MPGKQLFTRPAALGFTLFSVSPGQASMEKTCGKGPRSFPDTTREGRGVKIPCEPASDERSQTVLAR